MKITPYAVNTYVDNNGYHEYFSGQNIYTVLPNIICDCILKVRMGHFAINFLNGCNLVRASLSEPHTSETLVLSTIHKKLWIKIGELTTPSILILLV